MMSMQPQLIVVEQTDPPRPPADTLPTMYELPSENPEEPGLDQFHSWQAELLTQTFLPPDYPREEMLIASDLNLYYDVHHTNYYKRPDWYVVLQFGSSYPPFVCVGIMMNPAFASLRGGVRTSKTQ